MSTAATVPTRQVQPQQLRPGLYVHLDLGWLDHPFPTNRFLIRSEDQLRKLRELGLRQVTIVPERCDPDALAALEPATSPSASAAPASPVAPAITPSPVRAPVVETLGQRREALRDQQQRSLERSQRLHSKAVQGWQDLMRDVTQDPVAAAEVADGLARQFVSELGSPEDTTIRVLSEAAGTGQSQHAVNVTVLSLMLGRKLGLSSGDLQTLAVGALMHDLGKLQIGDAGRFAHDDRSPAALKACRDHIAHGVRLGMSLGLEPLTLRVIAQHHEMVDGSGLPQGLKGEEISLPARIVALANLYDELCNPEGPGTSRTPHEAQAMLYAQKRRQLDAGVLAGFIKLVGVYPPGSVVQLTDDRYALVVATHPEQPLKPSVIVHDPAVPRDQALVLDLAQSPRLGVKRSLHPQHLPRATMDYLSPGQRVHYYFSQGLQAAGSDVGV